MFERENHFTYVFYWYNYVLFSIDLKKNSFWQFFHSFLFPLPYQTVRYYFLPSLNHFANSNCIRFLFAMNHVHQIEHTTHTHTPQKCQDNNMEKKYTKTARWTPNSCVIQRQGVYDWSGLGIIKHTRGIIYYTAVWFLCSKIRHQVFSVLSHSRTCICWRTCAHSLTRKTMQRNLL